MTQATQQIPEKVPPLNTLPLQKGDWAKLRDAYGAAKGGAWKYEDFTQGAAPGFKLAAQIDLDRFHGGEEHELDWAGLFGQPAAPPVLPEEFTKPSLTDLAAMIAAPESGLVPAPEKIALPTPTFTDAELGAIMGAFFVERAEVGEHTPAGESVIEKIKAYRLLTGQEA